MEELTQTRTGLSSHVTGASTGTGGVVGKYIQYVSPRVIVTCHVRITSIAIRNLLRLTCFQVSADLFLTLLDCWLSGFSMVLFD